MICSAIVCDAPFMLLDTPGSRLKWARKQAGYPDASAFAKAAGVHPTTYRAYENDQNGYAARAPEFARKLGVTADWLIAGGPSPDIAEPSNLDDFSWRIPNEGQLADLLSYLLRRMGLEVVGDQLLLSSAAILRDILQQFADDPSSFAESGRVEFAAQTVARLTERRRA